MLEQILQDTRNSGQYKVTILVHTLIPKKGLTYNNKVNVIFVER